MKPLTLSELAARYNKPKKELIKYFNEHQADLPSGCKMIDTKVFNIPLIEYLDTVFEVTEDENSKDEATIQLLTAENSELKNQIEKLKESNQAKDKELTSSKNDLKDLEDKFLEYQDHATAGTKQMVDKLRNENEILKNQVSNFEQLKAEQLATKDARINELKNLVADLEDMVSTNASLTEEKMKFELKSKQLNEKYLKLQKTIDNFSTEKALLENEISRLKENKTYIENEVTELQGTLNGVIKSITSILGDAKLKLEGVDKTVTTIPDFQEVKQIHSTPVLASTDEDEEEEAFIEPAPIEEAPVAAAEIRQDDDDEGADAMPPRTPHSF